MNRTQNIKGFTIIEVVLVLAIAGLIFLMVFIALPALQAGQRDTARKNDASIVSTAVTNYISTNRGTFPNTTQLQSYVTGLSDNTSTTSVSVPSPVPGSPVAVTDGSVIVIKGKKCGAPDSADAKKYSYTNGLNREFIVITLLEGGGGAAMCIQGS